MFAQIIRGTVSDPAAVHAAVSRWMTDLGPTAAGWLGSTGGVTDEGELFVLARFDSAESAKANSDRPEQGRWWAGLEQLFSGEPAFADSTDVTVDTLGDPDTAGFVQVISGQVSDLNRAKQLMSAEQPDMRSLRPDVIGSVSVGGENGNWTMVTYFTSETEARQGERKELPAEAQKIMQEMEALTVRPPEYLDLRSPWLDSPG